MAARDLEEHSEKNWGMGQNSYAQKGFTLQEKQSLWFQWAVLQTSLLDGAFPLMRPNQIHELFLRKNAIFFLTNTHEYPMQRHTW